MERTSSDRRMGIGESPAFGWVVSVAIGLCGCASAASSRPTAGEQAPTTAVLRQWGVGAERPTDGDTTPTDPLAVLPSDSLALDPADGVTPMEAAYLALRSNPSLQRARADLRLEGIALVEAGVLPDPELSGTVGLPLAGAGSDDGLAWSLGMAWEVTGGLGRQARIDAASRTGDAVRLEVAWQEWGVLQETRSVAIDGAALSGQEEQLDDWCRALTLRVARLEEEAALGLVERRWADEAQRKLAELESRRALTQADHQASLSALRRLMGLPPATELRVIDDEPPAPLPPRDALLDHLGEHRLDLLALARRADAGDASLRDAEITGFVPLTLGVSADADTTGLLVSTLSVSIPFPLGGRRAVAIERARDDRRRALDEEALTAREAAADVAGLYDECATWRGREVLAESRQAMFAGLAADRAADVEAGLATLIEAEQLRDDQRDAELELADTMRQSRRATVALEYAAGWLFTEAEDHR